MDLQFKLNEFTVDSRWWNNPNHQWTGGGHTAETDPTKKGWRAVAFSKGSSFVLIGRKGVPGCFSARLMSDGRIDVAIYDEAVPETAVAALDAKELYADVFRQVHGTPGWALEFIQELESR